MENILLNQINYLSRKWSAQEFALHPGSRRVAGKVSLRRLLKAPRRRHGEIGLGFGVLGAESSHSLGAQATGRLWLGLALHESWADGRIHLGADTCPLGAPAAARQGHQFEARINPKIRPVKGAAAARFRLNVDD